MVTISPISLIYFIFASHKNRHVLVCLTIDWYWKEWIKEFEFDNFLAKNNTVIMSQPSYTPDMAHKTEKTEFTTIEKINTTSLEE